MRGPSSTPTPDEQLENNIPRYCLPDVPSRYSLPPVYAGGPSYTPNKVATASIAMNDQYQLSGRKSSASMRCFGGGEEEDLKKNQPSWNVYWKANVVAQKFL